MSNKLKDIIQATIVTTTVAAGFNQVRAAKELGISRGALRLYLKDYVGMSRDEKDNNLKARVVHKYMGDHR